jgi:hypothetical protein
MLNTELEILPVSSESLSNVNTANSQEYSTKFYVVAFVILMVLAGSIFYWQFQKGTAILNRSDDIAAKRKDLEKQKLAIIRATAPVKSK